MHFNKLHWSWTKERLRTAIQSIKGCRLNIHAAGVDSQNNKNKAFEQKLGIFGLTWGLSFLQQRRNQASNNESEMLVLHFSSDEEEEEA